ncbi:MAG TPA: NrdH-redoxin [Anaeromyxobacteraceae bacterium]|nr:NrdH-redoxin [Anaeromyxobacteraceae bacterium]
MLPVTALLAAWLAAAPPPADLVVYWGIGCPHCEDARPAVEALLARNPGLSVEWIEVRLDADARRRFEAEGARLGLQSLGVPTFVVRGREAIVGFQRGVTEGRLEAALRPGGDDALHRAVRLPWLGELDPARIPFPLFTVAIGLVDGVNPCAMYVLVVLLGILLHARSRRRVALYGGIFVAASGVVYFLFMSAWLGLFALTGIGRTLTLVLGGVLVAMGLLNLKDVLWLKRGPSLVIPEAAKPGIFRRMRAVAEAASLPVAVAGITTLALLVNLVELGCTLGLPAVYTRILSLRPGTGPLGRVGWLALYDAAYVVPLGIIVLVAVLTMRKLSLGERGARALKAVSGVLLLLFGLLFLVAPDALR